MSDEKVPDDRKYTKSHEWVRTDGDVATVGITDHAQSELTDIVFVDVSGAGKTVAAGGTVLTLESVKTVADVYAPVPGTVAEVNPELKSHPEYVNQDPYGKGWIVRITATGPAPEGTLLSAEEYRAFLASGA
jgi:glycine cleavage system H protein